MSDSKYTYQDVKFAVLAVASSLGRPAAIDLLARYGARRGIELPPDCYDEFIAVADELVSGADKTSSVPRGMEEDKPKEMFRIGGVYRSRGSGVFRITHESEPGIVKLLRLSDDCECLSDWRLSDGKCIDASALKGFSKLDLLPGELHQVDGQWVPVEEEGVENEAEVAAAIGEVIARVVARKQSAPEKQHPRLTWADPKPTNDRWAGFTVKKSTQEQTQSSLPDGVETFVPFRFGSANLMK